MPFSLNLPATCGTRWKVKIFDKERLEPPHATIIRGRKLWRICLRTQSGLDGSDLSEVDGKVLEEVLGRMDELIDAWNERYPDNPV
jgi:hypothetical protein